MNLYSLQLFTKYYIFILYLAEKLLKDTDFIPYIVNQDWSHNEYFCKEYCSKYIVLREECTGFTTKVQYKNPLPLELKHISGSGIRTIFRFNSWVKKMFKPLSFFDPALPERI